MKPVKDPQVTFIENSILPDALLSYFPEWEDGRLVMCPFHSDTKASLSISASGKACCHGCGFKARDIVVLVAAIEDLGYEKTRTMLYEEIVNAIPESKVQAHAKLLRKYPRVYRYLMEKRNLPHHIISQYDLGYEPETRRIIIPIRDQFGTCVNLRRLSWMKKDKGREKALNVKGHGEVRLFPENKIMFERRLLLVEGEWDCLVGRAFGLPTVTWTGGAQSWNEKYQHFFKDKAVWVLYDNDPAGKEGTEKVEIALLRIAHTVKRATYLHLTHGKDLTDWSFSNPVALSELALTIKSYHFPKREKQKKICPHCGQEVKR